MLTLPVDDSCYGISPCSLFVSRRFKFTCRIRRETDAPESVEESPGPLPRRSIFSFRLYILCFHSFSSADKLALQFKFRTIMAYIKLLLSYHNFALTGAWLKLAD